MSKIFRLHTGTTESIEHWQQLPSYIDHNSIDKIQDPSGLSAKTQITSVPTPFARMDLVKSAFLYVASNNKIDGTTIYHRMISDCLDVAEIFYNIEGFGNKIEILEWNSGIFNNGGVMDINPESDLGKLIHSSNPKHKLLGETLKMYLLQDKKHFNFSELKHIYILNYKNGPEPLNIIGGTSPTTLFFSSANNLSYVDLGIANDKFFDGTYCPLYKRTPDFIKYIYTIQNVFPSFSEKFKGFNSYLDISYTLLPENLKEVIREIKRNSQEYYNSNFNNISVKSAGNLAEIMGFGLKAKKYDVKVNTSENDFIIEATKNIIGDIPCALPMDAFNEELNYGGGKWQKDWYKNVPKIDRSSLGNRTLPNQVHVKYPYITVGDIFEPYIIRVPYPTDNEKFFNGNYEITQGEKDHGFILPLKREILNYFSVIDIQGYVGDGKKMFELKQSVGGVTAIIRIPIKNNKYIQYSRSYIENKFQDRIQQADEDNNLGIIIENQFAIAIYPFLKHPSEVKPHYRVMLADRDVQALNKHYTYKLSFFSDNNAQILLPSINKSQRSSKNQSQNVTTDYYVVENEYDFIEVKHNLTSGIIVPKFKCLNNPSKKFKFAVDFGTTNTHIEYKENGGTSEPFNISTNDIQMGTLYLNDLKTNDALRKISFDAEDLINIIKEEFVPFLIDKDSQYKFPQRTVINDNGSFNPIESNFALADFNIPFWYLKEAMKLNSNITPNLKWIEFGTDKQAERRTRAFLKQLMMMMRNKVLLNGGSLKETEIVWFYPSSMPTFRKKQLESAWGEFYNRYFGDYNKLYKLSESFAPFYYYYHKEGVKPHDRPAVNIDIGGGTTDIVVYKSETPILLSSFRFASNSIFGDGYGYTSKENGFIQKYEPIIEDSLSKSATSLQDVYNSIKKSHNSIELCEFFFSLEENKLIKDNKIPLSFTKLLTDDHDMKLVFVFFYSAIVYHIANLMKSKNLEIPQYITFSGNGSRLIKIISGGKDLSVLNNFTKVIFKDVYHTNDDFSIEFRLHENPKEITCKGGLECTDFSKFEALEKQILNVLIGIDKTSTIPPEILKYNQIENDNIIGQVKMEVSSFIDSFFGYNSKFNFFDNFGINPRNLEKYKLQLKEGIGRDLVSGMMDKLSEVNDNVDINIEETLFFYPLKGCINKLASQIYIDQQV